ncbi:Na+/H+ antiporter NhaC family protein [Proteocatella sphenisci]|uniref:Na+/H+ antiporter NhaC family protein n=1 Tax=Proteocatella sphenisci TaxID=181070 RepID=UPI00048F6DB0|nr:Na+/H+ antiporter NhaC family protein [Proteocatella sphenisci]
MNIYKKLSANLITVTIFLIASSVYFGFSLILSFATAILYSFIVLQRNEFDIRLLLTQSLDSVLKYIPLYITIFLIGATVSMWLSSGVIASMIYYGFNYVRGINFLFFSFIIITMCSVFMGTAVGTFSTIGLILYSIGSAIGIPPHIMMGTIVSGAFIADKISPLSGLMNIVLKVTETNYNKTFKSMMYTLIPSMLLTLTFYLVVGNKYIVGDNMSDFVILQGALKSSYIISPWLLLFPIFIILMSSRGINSLFTVGSGVLIGSFLTIFVQGYSDVTTLGFLVNGFVLNSDNTYLSSILHGGGVAGMIEVIAIVVSAIFLVSIFEKSGIINYIIGNYIKNIKNPSELIMKTAILSGCLTILTCDQTVGIVLPGTFLKEKYENFGIDSSVLARTISDSGIIIAPIIPWNINFIIITSIISTGLSFIPYAVFCFICPLVTIISSFFIKKKSYNP